MGFSVYWSWFAPLILCLLFMGGNVLCDCTLDNMEIEGGNYTLTKNLQRGSLLIYHCPKGYFPYPAVTYSCELDNTWKSSSKIQAPQKCRMVECPDPNVLENGDVFPPEERYFYQNTTTYECYSGYTLHGSPTRVCQANGKWSDSTPVCSRDTEDGCADPGVPPGAQRRGNQFGISDKVYYRCNNNLFLKGSKERECQENGQWSGIEPECYYTYTYDTANEISESFGPSIKYTLNSLEPTEEIQEGKMIRLTKNGTLNIYIAVDISESITVDEVTLVKDTVKKLITKISSFSVTPNYDIIFFSSVIFKIVDIVDFFGANKHPLQKILADLQQFGVNDRGPDETGTDLNLAFDHILKKMAYIKQQAGESFINHQHALIFFTDGAYNLGGEPYHTVAKIKSMVYGQRHLDEEEFKKRVDNLDIYIFGIGQTIYHEDLQRLVAGNGQHYFVPKALENLQATFDKIIDEEAVKGLCGLHKYYNSEESKRKKYPWLVEILVKNRDNCLGSLVSPQFILTAAHCFRFGDEAKDINIEMNDATRTVYKAKKLYLHEQFNISAKVKEGVKEFYDYDLALIQLQQPVKISDSVRHICIPCTLETNEALRLGDASCRKQEELLFKTYMEDLTFLSKKTSIEAKYVKAKLGGNRADCIRHALTAPGMTITDPEVAVTDSFLCTGGRTPTHDYIACTGDSGGAVFKDYEERTVQVGVVSWGTKKICSGGGLKKSDDTSRDFHINLFRMVPFLQEILGKEDQTDYEPLQFVDY